MGAPGRAWIGGDRRREPGPGDPGPGAAGRRRAAPSPRRAPRPERVDQPLDEDRLGTPQRLEAVDLDLEQAERRVGRVGAAGDPRAERRERLERGLDAPPGPRRDPGR